MKILTPKSLLALLAAGVISCTLFNQQAQAVGVTGAITFSGGVQLNSPSVNTATQVTGWLDQMGNPPQVESRSGSFLGFVAANAPVAFFAPWNFNSGAIAGFWTVGGFTFNLISSSIMSQGGGFLNVSGIGTITGNGFDPTPGTWSFSTQDPSAGTAPPVFSFSASTQAIVPEGGATVALLGLGLAGIAGLRRKLRRVNG